MVFDPLNRPICSETITVAELKQNLVEMQPIKTNKVQLNLPLRNELIEKFEKAIDEEFRKCSRIIEIYMKTEYRENLGDEFN